MPGAAGEGAPRGRGGGGRRSVRPVPARPRRAGAGWLPRRPGSASGELGFLLSCLRLSPPSVSSSTWAPGLAGHWRFLGVSRFSVAFLPLTMAPRFPLPPRCPVSPGSLWLNSGRLCPPIHGTPELHQKKPQNTLFVLPFFFFYTSQTNRRGVSSS